MTSLQTSLFMRARDLADELVRGEPKTNYRDVLTCVTTHLVDAIEEQLSIARAETRADLLALEDVERALRRELAEARDRGVYLERKTEALELELAQAREAISQQRDIAQAALAALDDRMIACSRVGGVRDPGAECDGSGRRRVHLYGGARGVERETREVACPGCPRCQPDAASVPVPSPSEVRRG